MLNVKLSPIATGGNTLVEHLTGLKQANQRELDDTSTLLNAALEISQRLTRAAAGTESILEHQAESVRWRFYRNLTALKKGNHPPELVAEFDRLNQAFDEVWDEVKKRWFPREIRSSLADAVSRMEEYRAGVLPSVQGGLGDVSPHSDNLQLLKEKLATERPITDEDIYLYVHHSIYAAEPLDASGRKLLDSASHSLSHDFISACQRMKTWEAALEEMRRMGWCDANGRLEIGTLPPDFNGATRSTLRILEGSEAGAFLKDRLALQRQIGNLQLRKDELHGPDSKGIFSGIESWWVDLQLKHCLSLAMRPPSTWIRKTFHEISDIALFVNAEGTAVAGDEALKRCGADFAKRALSLELRWGSYRSNLDGSTGNAILMTEELDSIEDRRLGRRRTYGRDFNRAELGAALFEYAARIEPLPHFLMSACDLTSAQLGLPLVDDLETQIAHCLERAKAPGTDTTAASEELYELMDTRDSAFLATAFATDLGAAAARLKLRFAVDYNLNPRNPLLGADASPYLSGAESGLAQVLHQCYPRLVNQWFGQTGHPGMDYTPNANDYGKVPNIVYEVILEFDDPSKQELVLKQIHALVAAGALPAQMHSPTSTILPQDSAPPRTRLTWQLEQPVPLPDDKLYAVTESVGYALRSYLTSVVEHEAAIRSELRKVNASLGISLRLSPAPATTT